MSQITVNDLTQLLNLNKNEATSIYKKYAISLKKQTKEDFCFKLNLLKNIGVKSNSFISSIALSNFNIFLVDNKLFEQNLTYIVNRFNLLPIVTKNFLTCKAHRLLSLDHENLIKRLNEVKETLDISEYTLRKLLAQTISLTSTNRINELYEKIKLLNDLSVDYKTLSDLSILNNNIAAMKSKIYIGKIAGINDEVLATNAHISINSIYARFMAWYNGEISSKDIFTNACSFEEKTGLSLSELMLNYPFGPYQQKELELIFKTKCPDLYKQRQESLIKFYDELIAGGTKPFTIRNLITDVLANIGFSDLEINALTKNKPELFKLNPVLLEMNLNTLKDDFSFSKEELYYLICNNLTTLCFNTDKYQELYNLLNEQNKITYAQFKKYLLYNKNADELNQDFINKYTTILNNICGFTAADCSALLKTSPAYCFTTPNRLLCKLKVLELFGISKSDLNYRYEILTPGFRKLARSLKVNALCTPNDSEQFINSGQKLPVFLLNTRFLYLVDNNLDLSLIYTPTDVEFEELTGASKGTLYSLYNNSDENNARIDEIFSKTYPSLDREINALNQIYDTIKEENFTASIENENYIQENAQLIEKVFKLNSLGYSIDEQENIETLLTFGYSLDEITQKPNALKLENQTLRVRLALAELSNQSHESFLSGGYKKREDKIFARFMGLKASLGNFDSIYLNEEQFSKCTGLKTDKLAIIFPYTEETPTRILKSIDNIVENANDERQ